MGITYKVALPNGENRDLAYFSSGRSQMFLDIAKILEKYVQLPCGIAYDSEEGDMMVNADLFPQFFNEVWEYGWLGDGEDSFIYGWVESAAGILENMTLIPVIWIDRRGKTLVPQRYASISDEDEATLQKRKDENKAEVRDVRN